MATKKKAPVKAKATVTETPVEPVDQKAGRRLKKIETVRSRADKASNAKPKSRVVRKTAGAAAQPFKAVGRLLAKIFRPLAFLLWPFKTRPVRFIGRVVTAILFLKFIRNSAREVRTVSWPDMRTTIKLALNVFAFAFVFGTIIAVVDYGLDKVFKELFLK